MVNVTVLEAHVNVLSSQVRFQSGTSIMRLFTVGVSCRISSTLPESPFDPLRHAYVKVYATDIPVTRSAADAYLPDIAAMSGTIAVQHACSDTI